MTNELRQTIKDLLIYSFTDIHFKWEGLTAREKEIVGTPERFAELVQWARQEEIPET